MKHLITLFLVIISLTLSAQTEPSKYTITYKTADGKELIAKTTVNILFTQNNPNYSNLKVIQNNNILFDMNLEFVRQKENSFIFMTKEFYHVETDFYNWTMFNEKVWIEIKLIQ